MKCNRAKEGILTLLTSAPCTHLRPLDSCATNLVYLNCTFSSSIFIQTATLNMSIYYATVSSREELQDFIVLLTYRKQNTRKPPLPGLGWRHDLTEETIHFNNTYLQTGFVRKLEKGRITTVLRGELLRISIQGGFSSNMLSYVNFNTTTSSNTFI